jgi:P4 family phage/plasmid primase-like protien
MEGGLYSMSLHAFDPLTAMDAADLLSFESHAEPTEFCLVNLLDAKMQPALTVGAQWFLYRDGSWCETEKAALRPIAQSLIPAKWRTVRKERAVIDHLEGRLQKPRESLASFHRWDGDSVLLNLANGTLRVTSSSVELLSHRAEDLFCGQIAAAWDAAASAPIWERVLAEAVPDPEDQELLRLCAGNILLPDARHEVCLVCYGEAGTGKSTIAEGIISALGKPLVRELSLSQICDPTGYHVPELQHAAINLGTELEALELADSSHFKRIISGENVMARPIYGKPFSMATTCKLWFLANALPRFKHGTDAEIRRVRFIRFQRKPEKKDESLKAAVREERDGILFIMVHGLQTLMTKRIIHTGGAESRATLMRFSITNDPLGQFLKTHCALDPKANTSKDDLEDAYKDFLCGNGLPEGLGSSLFKHLYDRLPQLKSARLRAVEGRRVQAVSGIKLNPTCQ